MADPNNDTQEEEHTLEQGNNADTQNEDATNSDPCWGKLISLNPKFPNVDLRDASVVLGRSNTGCDISFNHPAISGKHCRVFQEKGSIGNVVLVEDTSTNGTFVNGEMIGKGKKKLLYSGCSISLLPKKNEDKIAFVFVDCSEEKQEEDSGGPQKIYDMREVLGTGTFATVRFAVHRVTGMRVAVKVIDKQKFMRAARRPDALMDEVKVLTTVSHENIIKIHEMFESHKALYIVLELVTGGELFDRIVQDGVFPEDRARNIFVQILRAVEYLHSNGIAHRDLKPENILLKAPNDETVKISDFGLSRILDEGSFMKTLCGTPQYVAPEILTKAENEGYGKAVDLWSLGVILFILLSGYPPFEDEKNMPLFEKVKKGIFEFDERYWSDVSDEAKDLITGLLKVNPRQRITVQEALAHPWSTGASSVSETKSVAVHSEEADETQNKTNATPETPTKPLSARRKRKAVTTNNDTPSSSSSSTRKKRKLKPTPDKSTPNTRSKKRKQR